MSLFVAFMALDLLPCMTMAEAGLFAHLDASVSGPTEREGGWNVGHVRQIRLRKGMQDGNAPTLDQWPAP